MTIPTVTMEIHEHPNKKFMKRFERYEPVILDHTAMITAKRCLRQYFYQIVLGYNTKEEAIYFAWGSAYHRFRHTLTKVYGLGNKPFDENKALDAMLAATNDGMKYWRTHGKDQEVGSKYGWMTQQRLLQSFKVAYEHWCNEKKRGAIEVIAAEQPFNIQLPDGSHRSGRADEIVRWNGKLWGRDFKTSSKDGVFYERTLDPNEQFTGYTYAEGKLAGEQIQGQLVEVMFNANPTKNKTNGPEIIPLTASRTSYQLETWELEHMFYKKIIDQCREEDTWPMMEVSCPFCHFHTVCKQGSEASMEYQLETGFVVRPWDSARVGVDL